MKEVTQYRIIQETSKGKLHQIVWLDAKLKIGDEISLKHAPNEWWKVQNVYSTTTLAELGRHRTWNNNI